MKKLFLTHISTILLMTLLLPVLAFAQGTIGGVELVGPVGGSQVNVTNIIRTIVNWATGLLILLAVLFIVGSVFIYITAVTDEKQMARAKYFIVYAAVAIAVALLAQGIVFIVMQLIAPSVSAPGAIQ